MHFNTLKSTYSRINNNNHTNQINAQSIIKKIYQNIFYNGVILMTTCHDRRKRNFSFFDIRKRKALRPEGRCDLNHNLK